MNKRIISVFILLVALIGSTVNCGRPAGEEKVTFDQLFARPNEYNGKDIILDGFYFSGFEVQALSESLEYSGYAEGHLVPAGKLIWVEGGIPKEIYDQLYRQSQMGPEERFGKIRLEGKFEYGGSYGHLGGYDSFITPMTVELLAWSPPAPGTPPPTATYSLPELKYLVLASFDDVFWCDPDFYPVGRPGGEEQSAQEQFPDIKANEAEFSAILQHLGLPDKAEYTDEEKLLIYREHKRLTYQVEMTQGGDIYQFTLRVGEGQGERIEGTVSPTGDIEVLSQEPSFNTCPICLVKGTFIGTPGGPVPVEQLHQGMPVWTADIEGNKVAGVIVRSAVTPVPASFQAINITLSDGRTVAASPRHPTLEEKALGQYQVGDTLDGTIVTAVDYFYYEGYTYDLLPSGGTGIYWANGILLKSTLLRESAQN
jgi:hypothetical protein